MKKPQKIAIGIPRALLYFKYGVFWEAFFEKIGCTVIISPDTDKVILKDGLKNSVDESCLSVKIFIGHVYHLLLNVDFILIPRIASLSSDEYACTKFYSLFDMESE